MPRSIFVVPPAHNEPVYSYMPGSYERKALFEALSEAYKKEVEIPMFINGAPIQTGQLEEIRPPHDLQRVLGFYHRGDASHVRQAVDAALAARHKWMNVSWKQRASIFLKAADLIAGPYRAKLNAATMLGQSKSAHQSEIDAGCEMVDFLRFNVEYMADIYSYQPTSFSLQWNRIDARPLEGFVFAVTPFNFTSIAGNLPTAPAMMGNTVVWKPARTQIYSAAVLMEVFTKAGLPDGVINMVFVSGPEASDTILQHPMLAGIHFTGSTPVFKHMWKTIGRELDRYKNYPRLVGETGGKNFVLMHHSADPAQVATGLTRGAFEYQGQKCSAASRAYIPHSRWQEVREELLADLRQLKVGPPDDFTNFMNAVIDEGAFDKIARYIDNARGHSAVKVLFGGNYDKSKGYFIEPTVLLAEDPHYITMEEEIFGPVLTVYVYDDQMFDETLDLIDNTSVYGLTGSIFATDRYVIQQVEDRLMFAAGNFYINDKPTGAVVNQQPFGGSRASGTNDKAGSLVNLLRWVSPRTIKENFMPPDEHSYPFMLP